MTPPRDQRPHIFEARDRLGESEEDERADEDNRGKGRGLHRPKGALTHELAPAPRPVFTGKRQTVLALALQPAFVPRAVPFDGDTLGLQPALMVGEVRFRG